MKLLVLSVVGLLCSAAAEAQPAVPQISFGETSIRATPITPRGEAIFFGVARVPDPESYMTVIKRWQGVVSSNADGIAELDLGEAVPIFSVWSVIDATNRQFGVAGPAGYPARPAAIPPGLLQRGTNMRLDQVSFDHPYLDLLYVEPNGGTWSWHDLDGTPTDRDGRNGRAAVSTAQGKRLGGGSGSLEEISPGGILIAIDFMTLEILAVRVDGALAGGAR